MGRYRLIDMMFAGKPIEEFERIMRTEGTELEWAALLSMCYCEKSYESVGGDEGYKKNPPINKKRIAYLSDLIAFLEDNGVKRE